MAWIHDVDDVMVLLCTVDSEDQAAALSRALVTEGLAACVNVIPGLRSYYQWKGEACDDPELLLVIKTARGRMADLAKRVEALHPYDTPELIALPVQAGLEAYLQWVREETLVDRPPRS